MKCTTVYLPVEQPPCICSRRGARAARRPSTSPCFDQRLEAAADHLDFLLDRQACRSPPAAPRPPECAAALRRATIGVRRNVRQHVADEMDLFGGEKAAASRVVGELPGLFGDPRHHRRQHEVEPPAALARARLVVQPAHVALQQGLEQLPPNVIISSSFGSEPSSRFVYFLMRSCMPMILPNSRRCSSPFSCAAAWRGHARAAIAREHLRELRLDRGSVAA